MRNSANTFESCFKIVAILIFYVDSVIIKPHLALLEKNSHHVL